MSGWTNGKLSRRETERLLLREVKISDADDIFAYASDPKVSKYVSWEAHYTKSETVSYIKYILDTYKNGNLPCWGIEWKETGELIGTIDFVMWKPAHKTAEIGYVLSRDYWGKGIMTEAAKELIAFGFDELSLVRIQARCFNENAASEKVMQKIGMTFEGTMRKAMLVKGVHRDIKMYSIINN
ncbi:GNAT family N-acetyltransferase [Bacillus massiliglaciei]|uniref:GNAT family N-acetyltransferase n=1 Tax=Bacillus massiliglaciei TaxID=1816693 RepID=UPI000A510A25|nr:GNAT family protein [Bacillus massiliglaciei]